MPCSCDFLRWKMPKSTPLFVEFLHLPYLSEYGKLSFLKWCMCPTQGSLREWSGDNICHRQDRLRDRVCVLESVHFAPAVRSPPPLRLSHLRRASGASRDGRRRRRRRGGTFAGDSRQLQIEADPSRRGNQETTGMSSNPHFSFRLNKE